MNLKESTTTLFDRWEKTLNRRYGHSEILASQAHANLVTAFHGFIASGCADPHFLTEIVSSNHNISSQRLGEALLYERLSHIGLAPTSKSEGPDFCVRIDGRPVWLELITPTHGDDTRIAEIFHASDPLNPQPEDSRELSERTLLRVSSAIVEKISKYEKYVQKGIVKKEDALIIVINDSLLCPDWAPMYGVSHNADFGVGGSSLAEHAVRGVGPSYWEKIKDSEDFALKKTVRDVVKNRPEPGKDGGIRGPVPVSLFLEPNDPSAKQIAERAAIISGVLQITLREDYGLLMLLRSKAEGDERLCENLISKGTFVKNPYRSNPIDDRTVNLLTAVVAAPPLSPAEKLELMNRYLLMLFGE